MRRWSPYAWPSRFGDMLIAMWDSQTYVNGEPVRRAHEAGNELAWVVSRRPSIWMKNHCCE